MPQIPSYPNKSAPNDDDLLVIDDSVDNLTKNMTREDFLSGTPLPANTVDTQSIEDDAITTAKINANAVTAAELADSSVFPANLAAGLSGSTWAWQTWSPTYTNITIGNGTVTAKYIQIGKTIEFVWSFILGSTSAIGTQPTLTFPVTAVASPGVNTSPVLGMVRYYDHSATDTTMAAVTQVNTTQMRLLYMTGTPVGLATTTSSNPFTWNTSDEIHVQGRVEAA